MSSAPTPDPADRRADAAADDRAQPAADDLAAETVDLAPEDHRGLRRVGRDHHRAGIAGPRAPRRPGPTVAALTEVAVAAPAGRGVVRTILGVVSLVGGSVGMGATLFGDAGAAVLGAGAVAIFLGVAALASLIARPVTAVLGWPAARAGMSGESARANAMRNPRRTAATASALMIGLALVAWLQLGIGVVAAVLSGLAAGVLPARRAARMDVLRALQSD
jgi:hypothetical protein